MALNPNEDTEFNDALRKHGILPPQQRTPTPPSPAKSPKLESVLSSATPSELEELGEDAFDSDTERIIASYRRQRLAEMLTAEKSSRFGELYPIGREDYTKEVTDASAVDNPDEPEIKGTGVVCLLYKDGQVESTRLTSQLKTLAMRHPHTKFVSIVGDKCIPNYSEKLCPTIIIYRGGDVTRQVVAWGCDRERTLAELEAMLILSLAITTPPHSSGSKRGPDDEFEDDKERSTLHTSLKSGAPPSSRQQPRPSMPSDDESDFDL